MRASELAREIGATLLGPDCEVTLRFLPIDADAAQGISFCDHPNVSAQLTKRPLDVLDVIPDGHADTNECIARIVKSTVSVIVAPDVLPRVPFDGKTLLLVENPRLAFMELVGRHHVNPLGVHPSAVVEDCVRIGANVSIGACSVIGAPGFGMWRMRDGSLRQFPQVGGVIIEDDVTIKANVCIDRGALGHTIIGRGSRIDNLCHIAHNVRIGRNVSIVASSMIAGSVEIGDDAWVAPGARILNGIKVGREAVVGMGAIVIADVPEGATVKGLWKGE